MVVTSYYSLAAARKANETSEQAYRSGAQSLEISKRSQQLSEDVAARERLSGRAELLGTLEEERCGVDQEGTVHCRSTFTLTNAGHYVAENIAIAIQQGDRFGLSMSLQGDLPAGQTLKFETPYYEPHKYADRQKPMVLAVAYRDKELGICPDKSWAFQISAEAPKSDGVTKLVGAAKPGSSTSWVEQQAVHEANRKNCGELPARQP